MMSARQAAFRAAFRAQIAPAYQGLVHVALIYLIGGAALWYCAQQIHGATWAEWLVMPATVVLANIFEWFLHAQVMHRPRPGLMGIYKRHTLAHHQFFTKEAPFHDTVRDFRIVFFPPYALIAFLAMAAAGAFGEAASHPAAELAYWRLTGGFEPGSVTKLLKNDPAEIAAAATDAAARLRRLIAAFENPARPYLSQPHPGRRPRFAEYAHLARVAEWEGPDDGAGNG